MKFFSELMRGELILIRTTTPAPRPPAIPARRPHPGGDPLLVRVLLWLLATLGRPALATARRTWPPITPETLPVLRVGIVFGLLIIGSLAANWAAKGG